MEAYKENENIIKENFILKFFLTITIIGLIITSIAAAKLNNEYNSLYTEAIIKIQNDDIQIKELIRENRDLEIEYNELLKDNESNLEYIEWCNEQMELLRGEENVIY